MATMTLMKLARMTQGITLDQLTKKAEGKNFFYSRYHFARVENAEYNIQEMVQDLIAEALKMKRKSLFDKQGRARRISKKMLHKIEKLILDGVKS